VSLLIGFLVWLVLVVIILALFAGAKANDRRQEDARREREGLPPIDWNREP
jgi:hypothetical protein